MYTKDEIIQEIRRIAGILGVQSLKSTDFSKHTKIKLSAVTYHFGTWNEAINESGLTPINSREYARQWAIKRSIPEEELLLDLIRLFNEFGVEPNKAKVNSKGKYSVSPYYAHWKNIQEAFLIAKKRFPEKLSRAISVGDDDSTKTTDIELIPPTIKPKDAEKKRTVFGEPIDFRGLRFAPVNEQGVVFLFGMISRELGYLIESVRTGYPDCEGKRCFDKLNNQWEHVKIEFEFKSSHFKDHGHSEEECDLIVCWIHDWEDCPIEVLELKNTIRFLS